MHSAPVHQLASRQIGNLQCNIDRLKIVGDIFTATQTTNSLSKQLVAYVFPLSPSLSSILILTSRRDTTGASQISTVSDGLNQASAGITQIATALFTGQAAPAAARDQVEQGLNSAFEAASSIVS